MNTPSVDDRERSVFGKGLERRPHIRTLLYFIEKQQRISRHERQVAANGRQILDDRPYGQIAVKRGAVFGIQGKVDLDEMIKAFSTELTNNVGLAD